MPEMRVRTFFYGSYMNPEVLREVQLTLEDAQVACLPGFALTIGPLANLVRAERGVVYGVVASLSHVHLERLYAHAREKLGGAYLPEAVVVHTGDGRLVPALCYIAPELQEGTASHAYIDRIAAAARLYEFPRWYIAHIEGFRPS